MGIYCNGRSRIKHNESGEIYTIDSDELDWNAVGSDERQMGPEIHHEAVLDHPELGDLTWGLWEYPVGIENYRETEAKPHEVIEDFDYGLDVQGEEPEWLDYDVPDNPFAIFMNSYHQTGDMLADHGKQDGKALLNRMIFSHQVTALEAYLGDTLINAVIADADVMQRLLDKDDDLTKEKFTLGEISKDRELVKRKVLEHLRSVLYHNLAKVNTLYDIALRIRILDLTNDRASLFKAIMLRHDCVHRNGFDKDGNELGIFTSAFVRDTALLIKVFVEGIEKAVREVS